jgi:hypothetical protein
MADIIYNLDEMVLILRILIGDMDSIDYTDEKIKKILWASSKLVMAEISLYKGYAVSNVDQTTGDFTIEPDTITDLMCSLITMKAACMINTAQLMYNSAVSGFNVSCDRAKISSSAGSGTWQILFEKGPCETYNKLKLDAQTYNARNGMFFKAVIPTFAVNLACGCSNKASCTCGR